MESPRSPLHAFLRELEGRKVLRVLLAYLAVGWLVIEVADTVFPRLALPDWTVTLVVALVVLGLPVSLVLAWLFDVTPGGLERTAAPDRVEPVAGSVDASGAGPAAERAQAPARSGVGVTAGRIAVAGAVAVLALAGGAFLFSPDAPSAELDRELVAVLPFRVSGDASLEYLSTGMVDLLALSLTGEGGPRAVDPAVMLTAASSDSDERVARSVGAGQVLTGAVVGSPSSLTLSASLRAVGGGAAAEARVAGPADSLPHLVDRLVAQLLSLRAGEEAQRASALAARPLPAVRAFLEGQTAFRASRFHAAIDAYDRALTADSAFALAALQYVRALGWNIGTERVGDEARARHLAWTFREQLSAPDQLFLRAMLGPDYPAPSDHADVIREWEGVVSRTPDRPDAWFALGDVLMHYGALVDRPDNMGAAASAFRRALELDSTYVPALEHLMDLAAFTSDSAAVARLAALWEARDTTRYVRTRQDEARAAVGDTLALRRLRAGFEELDRDEALSMLWLSLAPLGGFTGADTDRLLTLLVEGSSSRAELELALLMGRTGALNEGRPQEALRLGERRQQVESWPGAEALERVWDALFWSGDSAAAEAAVDRLAPLAARTQEEPSDAARDVLCALSLWRLQRGEGAPGAVEILASHPAPSNRSAVSSRLCAATVEAWVSAERRPGVLTPEIERLDSLLARGTPASVVRINRANLVLARLLEQAGAPERALRAVRRRAALPGMQFYVSTALVEEGDLAAATGDTEGAIEAYSWFLNLHRSPEPSREAEVARVRSELQRLRGRG